MGVPLFVWIITLIAIIGLMLFDFYFHVRQPHIPTIREAAIWSAIYVGVAILFGILVFVFGGWQMGAEFFAGYTTEKALSVDNLFVFLIIISSFSVPREDQQKVLLFGIMFALIARSGFIALGKAMIENLSWTFYLFGAILLWTATKLLVSHDSSDDDDANNFIIRFAKKHLRTTDHYDRDRLFTYENGKRVLTPMLLVMVAIGGTDLLFAIDSVPAIYALTTNVYLVFTATAFSLMGLRQLYFLIDSLLDRLIFLSYGLAIILGFIGVKLVLEALHDNDLPFINGGQPLNVPVVHVNISLLVILSVLTVTVVASLLSPQGQVESVVKSLDRATDSYLREDFHPTKEDHAVVYAQILEYEAKMRELDPDRLKRTLEGTNLIEQLQRVHALHAQEFGTS